MRPDQLPTSVVFCDVETTGLGNYDRIVSFGAIGVLSRNLVKAQPDLEYIYLVFNPGTKNRRGAQRVHGFSDSTLRLQDRFAVHAADVRRFLTSHELLVAHNAAFDIRFINRELRFPATSSWLVLATCTTRLRTLGSRCRSICGCRATRCSIDCAARCPALHQTCVHPASSIRASTAPACPLSKAITLSTLPVHDRTVITMDGR